MSPYQGIYEAIIPANHLLRRIKENIDFSFVNPMLRKQYCEPFGRPAKEPEMMFKLLFLKKRYDLSDEILISSAQTDMACVSDDNLETCGKEITLIARTNTAVAAAANGRLEFEASEMFKKRMKIPHRIEEKNGELKEAHGLRRADSRGLFAMHLQMYFTAFTANIKRIVKLEEYAMT